MASLITLVAAKDHLRVRHNLEDADIDRKAEQATDIVLSYLKGRRIEVESITRSGAVATVTTSGVHGLTTGDSVTVFGVTEPEYNGLVEVTVTSTTTFTYAVTGSPASPATGMLRVAGVQPWTHVTVPPRVQAAIFMVLEHLWISRGGDMSLDAALWDAIARTLERDRDPAIA